MFMKNFDDDENPMESDIQENGEDSSDSGNTMVEEVVEKSKE